MNDTTTPSIRILAIRAWERDVVLRQPFRFGMLTLRECPQGFVEVDLEVDGQASRGIAAEMILPKWFAKNPDASNQEDLDQLRASLGHAARCYLEVGRAEHPYALHAACAAAMLASGEPPLVANFGSALIDRAIIDGVGRALALPAGDLVRRNLLGLDARRNSDLAGFDPEDFLSSLRVATSIDARHTVGMVDAITDADLAPENVVADGLPQSLEACARCYGHRWFKLKVGGDLAADIDRLRAIAEVLDALDHDYRCSLDGNEQYPDAASFGRLLDAIADEDALVDLRDRIAYIEQPIARSHALGEPLGAVGERIPIIIDESDGSDDAFPRARELGYRGVSSKQCKGFYRSLLNAARCALWNAEAGEDRYFLTGEDLVIQAGVALQQDLTLASLAGCSHLERNGHHYVNGLAALGENEQARFLEAYPRLYHREDGVTRLRIADGRIDLGDLEAHPGLGSGAEPDWTAMERVELAGVGG